MPHEIEFDPVDALAVGTVGPPGKRVFYVQATSGHASLTLLVEKAQVQALAERTVEVLQGHDSGPEETAPDLAEPLKPDWRAGELGLGFDDDRRRILLVAQELPESEEAEERELAVARLWIRPAQMLAFAVRGFELVRSGRPLCPICGLPMDPEGHQCPRRNGKSPIFN